MRISQLAERSRVPATTLRFYESTGLLPADRTPSGYRVYGEDAVDRLAFIGAAKHLGLPLEEVGELLAVWEAGVCAEVKADLRPRIAARLAEAERRVAELTAFTASLHDAVAHLDALPDRDGPCDPECGFLTPAARHDAGGDVEPGEERWRSAPVACSLGGDDLDDRVRAWREAVDGAVRTEIADGLRLTMPADRAGAVATLAAAEQRCCAFFDFRLRFDGRVVHLEVRVPAEGAGLLAELFDAPD
ncbi:MerR family transcriptional regulator [Actinophytocola sp. S1-96]|uniref:MerR family transcriptional regulator n=2 Tax=Actinophytocola gossypii TaxID=2812003 RepID=A0ABT2J3I2_9PSEU|nr:MerR family transcriptional regulator [Actinophytocola gossypii]